MCYRHFLALDKQSSILYPNGRIYEKSVDYKMIKAFWAFLSFRDKCEGVYPTEYPAQIYFVKNGFEYEIAVVEYGDEFIISSALSGANHKNIKILLLLDNPDQLKNIWVDNAVAYCLFRNNTVEYFKL